MQWQAFKSFSKVSMTKSLLKSSTWEESNQMISISFFCRICEVRSGCTVCRFVRPIALLGKFSYRNAKKTSWQRRVGFLSWINTPQGNNSEHSSCRKLFLMMLKVLCGTDFMKIFASWRPIVIQSIHTVSCMSCVLGDQCEHVVALSSRSECLHSGSRWLEQY